MTIEFAENDIREAFAEISFDRSVSRIISGAKRRRHRRRMAIGAVPAVGLMAAGGVALLTADDLVLTNVVCFSKADLNDPQLGITTPPNDGRSPEALCAEHWAHGGVAPGVGKGPVPPLTVCALDDGRVGVFPTKDEGFCSTDGLQPMPDGYGNRVEPFAEMNEDMAVAIRDAAVKEGGSEETACLGSDTALGVVTEVMKQHGYGDWTVRIGLDRGGPCRTDIGFDSEAKVTTIYSNYRGAKYITINVGS